MKFGYYEQVIARDKEDMDARWDRAVMYNEIGEPRKVNAKLCLTLAPNAITSVWTLLQCRQHMEMTFIIARRSYRRAKASRFLQLAG